MPSHVGVELPYGLYQTQATVTQGYNGSDHGNPAGNPFDAILYYSVDFAVPINTPVVAEGNGTVVSVINTFQNYTNFSDSKQNAARAAEDHGYGNLITIYYDNGYYATYLHLAPSSVSKINLIAGNRVRIGDEIGSVGATGNETGPHIHATYGLNAVPISSFSNNSADRAYFADGRLADNSGPPVYFMATTTGLPPANGTVLVSDNLANYAGNVAPVVKTVPLAGSYAGYAKESVGANKSSTMQDWFFAGDADGDQVSYWAFDDITSDSTSGYLSVSSGYYYNSVGQKITFSGKAPSNVVVILTTSALNTAQFIGGTQSGKFDWLYIAAYDGKAWSSWSLEGVSTVAATANAAARSPTDFVVPSFNAVTNQSRQPSAPDAPTGSMRVPFVPSTPASFPDFAHSPGLFDHARESSLVSNSNTGELLSMRSPLFGGHFGAAS